MGTISAEEINYLVYRYMQESGFVHSAFTFAYESLISKSVVATTMGGEIPPGTLVAFLQKGLQLMAMEHHLNDDGSETIPCSESSDYTLLTPFIVQSVGSKPLETKDVLSKNAKKAKVARPDGPAAPEPSNHSNTNGRGGGGPAGPSLSSSPPPPPSSSSTTTTTSSSIGGGKAAPSSSQNGSSGAGGCGGGSSSSAGANEKLPPGAKIAKSDVTVLRNASESVCCSWNPADPNSLAYGNGDSTARIWSAGTSSESPSSSSSLTLLQLPVQQKATKPHTESGEVDTPGAPSGNAAASCEAAPPSPASLTASTAPPAGSAAVAGEGEGMDDDGDDGQSATQVSKRARIFDGKRQPEAADEAAAGATAVQAASSAGKGVAAAAVGGESASPPSASPPSLSGSETAGGAKGSVKAARRQPCEDRSVTALTWSPDGSVLATGGADGAARMFSKQGKHISTLAGHTQPIFSLQFSGDGANLLTGSYDFSTVVWDVAAGKVKQRHEGHLGQVLDVDWRPDDSMTFASGSSDHSIHVCRVGSSTPLHTFLGHTDEVNGVKWSPGRTGRQLLASCSDDSTVKLWSCDSGAGGGGGLVLDCREHSKEVCAVRWAPTGEGSANPNKPLVLASACFDSTVKLWDPETGQARHTLRRHDKKVYSVAFSPCGSYLASGALGGQLYIWDVKSGGVVRSFKGTGDMFEVAWNKAGDRLACCGGTATATSSVTLINFKV